MGSLVDPLLSSSFSKLADFFVSASLSWGMLIGLCAVIALLFHVNFRRRDLRIGERRIYSLLIVSFFAVAMVGGFLSVGGWCSECKSQPYIRADQCFGGEAPGDTSMITLKPSGDTVEVMYYPDKCDGVKRCSKYLDSSCEDYFMCKGGENLYDIEVAECKAAISDGDDDDDDDEEEKSDYEEDRENAKQQRDSWLKNKRNVCESNNGISYNIETYYCNGFQTIDSFVSPEQSNGNTFPQYNVDFGCCVGTPILQTADVNEIAYLNSPWVTGTEEDLEELRSTDVNLNNRAVIHEDGKSKVCFTSAYLCKDTRIETGIVTSDLFCEDEHIVYCPYGCDLNSAKCVNDIEGGSTSPDDLRGEWLNVGLEVIVIIGLIILIGLVILTGRYLR